MTRPGAPRWFERLPSHAWTLAAAFLDSAAHSSRADLVSTVAHEAAHAASILLDHLGHRLRGEDEPHAYLAGYVARCIWTHLEKRESA